MLILAVKKNGDRYGKLTISDATYNQQDEEFTTTIAVSAVVSCPEPPPNRGSSNIQRDSLFLLRDLRLIMGSKFQTSNENPIFCYNTHSLTD